MTTQTRGSDQPGASVIVELDQSLCTGQARCNATSPQLFPLDDEGLCAIRRIEVPDTLAAQARAGVSACPELALKIIG